MKSTGIVRRIDQLGRVVIPMELRKIMDILEGDSLEFFVENGKIMLKKYEPGCVLCGGMDNLQQHKWGKLVCKDCLS